MKMKLTTWFLAITAMLAVTLYAGCDKCGPEADEYHLYRLPSTSLNTVPYAIGDSFTMVDSTGATLTYAMVTSNLTRPLLPSCECCPSESYDNLEIGLNKDATPFGLRFVMSQLGDSALGSKTQLTVCLDSSCFYLEIDSTTLLPASTTTGTFHSTAIIGQHTYLNVYEFQNQTTDSNWVKTFWYSTQFGLLQYQKLNGKLWWLQY